ncbi:uncharacterized protein [Dermacentor andersoni]|uniref:uncharacterized protein n=1 Tax=Dermacentor andersoni TaxID=34620 RepID=UPI002155E1B0|nr:uncharacterized protein LOC126533118 [Dermacentor andersoni]
MVRRARRCRKSDAGRPARNVLGGIENIVPEPLPKKKIGKRAHTRVKPTSAAASSKPPENMLELGVSPIERRGGPLRRPRRNPASEESVHVATSTPDRTKSQPTLPDAQHVEETSHMSFDLDRRAVATPCLFDSAMTPKQTSRTGSPSRTRRKRHYGDSPELSLQEVRRTYSRGKRSASVRVNLFEDLELPDHVQEDEENFFEPEEEQQVKKNKVHKPKAQKLNRQNDRDFDEWVNKMAAEFDEIEKFELCYG